MFLYNIRIFVWFFRKTRVKRRKITVLFIFDFVFCYNLIKNNRRYLEFSQNTYRLAQFKHSAIL